MTRKDASDFNPRHRIIGAIVVTGLAVVLIPMVLSERASLPETGLRAPARVAPEPETAKKVVVMPVSPADAVAEPAGSPAPVQAPESSAPPRQPSAPVAAAPAKPEAGWVVQVGTFANAANAKRLEQKLKAGGQPILTERIRLEGGEAVRLRVGPFGERAAALEAQARIRKEVGLQGVVLAYP